MRTHTPGKGDTASEELLCRLEGQQVTEGFRLDSAHKGIGTLMWKP